MNQEQYQREIVRRTRAVMGMRGYRAAETRPVCLDAATRRYKPNMSNDELAAVARECADDTRYWSVPVNDEDDD